MTTIKRFTPDYKMHAVRFEAFAREAEHGELVRFDAHQQVVSAVEAERDAQQKRADALAVENQELKESAADLRKQAFNGRRNSHNCGPFQYSDLCESIIESTKVETPATDAALAAIQAQGVEEFAAQQEQLAADYRKISPGCYGETSSAENALMARDFAAKLREAK
ncbi:hypothetical protein I5T96_04455 [Serratia marcescens]|nr:hypothetical protein [Serratia marcescens]